MAAIQKVAPVFVSPAGYEVVDRGFAREDIEVGDPIVIDSTPYKDRTHDCAVVRATGTEAHGIALKTTRAGGTCEFAMHAEMDGFTGLTPGAGLTIVDGNIDDTAPAEGTAAQIRAVNTTRIRFQLV